MKKHMYMTKEELSDAVIITCNDYIGEIIDARWVDYLDEYEVTIEFYSKEAIKKFCYIYGYETTRLDKDLLVRKEEA